MIETISINHKGLKGLFKGFRQFNLISGLNGILHHTVMQAVWEDIFDVAIASGRQVIFTTLNKEMIQAFAIVAQKKGLQEKTIYFEMVKKGQGVTLIPSQMDMILYRMDKNLSFRGEI